uniref:ATP synthase FO subunit 8 n=1 Tax=Euhampsonia splendida TaxID=1502332 RepID=UPI00286C99A3|nr:ATP synthase FO subunit 8 [Euhampsonia splendida]WKR35960.1 ATP synthase FO subunit 8 [Euhampsonia splendida]
MPQMMPINWITSLFFFICIFLIFNMMNYYIFNYKLNKNIYHSNKKKNLNWKW